MLKKLKGCLWQTQPLHVALPRLHNTATRVADVSFSLLNRSRLHQFRPAVTFLFATGRLSVRPGPGAAYAASKGAVNSLTLYIARRYARYNIRANVLLLGYIDTPLVQPAWQDERVRDINLRQVPMRRFAPASEVGTVASFLASDEASYVTGVMMPVDGGLSVSM